MTCDEIMDLVRRRHLRNILAHLENAVLKGPDRWSASAPAEAPDADEPVIIQEKAE